MQADIVYSCAITSESDSEHFNVNEKIAIDHVLVQVEVEGTHEMYIVDIAVKFVFYYPN